MKTQAHYYIKSSLFAVLLCAVIGCMEDTFSKDPYSDPIDFLDLFTASVEDPHTGGLDVNWSSESVVGVFAGNTSNKSYVVKENMNTSAVFHPEDDVLIDGPIERVYGYYPFSPSVTMTGNQLTLEIPSIQMYHEDGPDPGIVNMVTSAQTRNMRFKYAFGAIKLKLANAEFGTVKKIVLKNMDGKAMSGQALINMDYDIYGEPLCTMAESAVDSIVMDCGEEGVAITTKGKSFCFVVPPANYEQVVFYITNTAGEVFESRIKEALDVNRGQIADAGLARIYIEEFFYGRANCHRFDSPGTYSFDVSPYYSTDSYGFAYEFNTREDLILATSADLLWQSETDMISGISLSADKKTANFTANKNGNALIGIYDENGEILWSYHVWIAPINDVLYPNGMVVMDRNLGAMNNTPGDTKSWGLYYQWGRKDPLPELVEDTSKKQMNSVKYYDKDNNSFSLHMKASSAGVDQYWATKNPTTFIARAGSTPDWVWECGNNRLWGNPEGGSKPEFSTLKKSVYDPCPEGYMVPSLDFWSGNGIEKSSFNNNSYDSKNKGRFFTGGGLKEWYPGASFYHNNYWTNKANTNVVGRYWTSSPNPEDASKAFGIVWGDKESATYPEWSVNRAFGYSVRCVREPLK